MKTVIAIILSAFVSVSAMSAVKGPPLRYTETDPARIETIDMLDLIRSTNECVSMVRVYVEDTKITVSSAVHDLASVACMDSLSRHMTRMGYSDAYRNELLNNLLKD